MRKHIVTSIFFCFILAVSQFFPLAQAQGENFYLRLPSYELYAPAKIIINFVYTNNVSVSVHTLGTSLYKATTSPVQALFEAEAFDVYTIDVSIEYGVPVNQTIIIGLYEGGRAAKGIEIDVSHRRIFLSMKVCVVGAPEYPAPEDIAEAMWTRLEGFYSEFIVQQQGLLDKMSETMLVIGSLAVISFVVCIIVFIVVFYMHRQVAELSEWGIRHETEHRKGGE